eukprot:gene10598-22130_t
MIFQVKNALMVCFVGSALAFAPKFQRSQFPMELAVDITDSSQWPEWSGDRLPIANLGQYEQKMDAAWGRGKFRTEVWDDDVNPSNDWWKFYVPSKEEREAVRQGFDFANPKEWFEKRGIDYEQAKANTKAVIEQRMADYQKAKAGEPEFSVENFKAVQQQYFDLQKKFFEFTFRLEDDKKQKLKGQPTLAEEDTGYQFKNDPA